jgi:mRNA-degrading endonuclease RelE of RelBE toxin-antitoxin system
MEKLEKIYKVIWEEEALKELERLDKSIGRKIYETANKKLAYHPYDQKKLTGD